MLSDPPILNGDDDPKKYYELLSSIADSVGAETAADWLLVETVAQQVWHLRQLRNVRSKLLRDRLMAAQISEQEAERRAYVISVADKVHGAEKDAARKRSLAEWRRIALGYSSRIDSPSSEYAFEKLAEMLAIKRPRTTPSGPPSAELQIKVLRGLEAVDDLIEKQQRHLERVLGEIDRRRRVAARLIELGYQVIEERADVIPEVESAPIGADLDEKGGEQPPKRADEHRTEDAEREGRVESERAEAGPRGAE